LRDMQVVSIESLKGWDLKGEHLVGVKNTTL